MHLTKAVTYLFELYFWISYRFVHLLGGKQSQQKHCKKQGRAKTGTYDLHGLYP